MFIISPFTPLFFTPSTDKYGARSKYIQKFASTDCILIEVLASSGEVPILSIINLINGTRNGITCNKWEMNSNTTLYFHVISGLKDGFYNIDISGRESEIFEITSDSNILAETTLIQYSMKDNRQRKDCIWWINGMQYFFDFRAPGGFKDDNWNFGVNNEQFVTSDEDIVEMYSYENTQKSFTLGNSIGCPIWFADLLNRILCCTYVYFDGVRYARKDGSVPELNQEIEGVKSYIFKQLLQQVKFLDPFLENKNQLILRGVEQDKYRALSDKQLRKV